MERFEELASTAATRDALEWLRTATGETEGAMERHSLRVRHIARELARIRGWETDEELLTVAAILHDIGLYRAVSHGGVYTAEGAELARRILHENGWSPERIERCAQAIDRHHDLRGQASLGGEVEGVRLADMVELSGGMLRFGLSRRWLRELNADVPRSGLVHELLHEVGRALRERPLTMARIFVRPQP